MPVYRKPIYGNAIEIDPANLSVSLNIAETAIQLTRWIKDLSANLKSDQQDRNIVDGIYHVVSGDDRKGYVTCELQIAVFVYDDRKRVIGRRRYGIGLVKRCLIITSYSYNNSQISGPRKAAEFYIDFDTNQIANGQIEQLAKNIHLYIGKQFQTLLAGAKMRLLI